MHNGAFDFLREQTARHDSGPRIDAASIYRSSRDAKRGEDEGNGENVLVFRILSDQHTAWDRARKKETGRR